MIQCLQEMHAVQENWRGNLAIFRTTMEADVGLILAVIHHTCTDSHRLVVIPFNILSTEVLETLKTLVKNICFAEFAKLPLAKDQTTDMECSKLSREYIF